MVDDFEVFQQVYFVKIGFSLLIPLDINVYLCSLSKHEEKNRKWAIGFKEVFGVNTTYKFGLASFSNSCCLHRYPPKHNPLLVMGR